jgi:hypothetical protein
MKTQGPKALLLQDLSGQDAVQAAGKENQTIVPAVHGKESIAACPAGQGQCIALGLWIW